ncbi:ABC transporter permease [Streptomyces ossamyceticus]|uniref:ABC transporter permease n=1 Tax=Streptomyces ossamyceticus TaxID=249581 RepID=UPI0006E1D8EE|nr:ABC-2 family transporter protein [Streptomyces ossamyceticus]
MAVVWRITKLTLRAQLEYRTEFLMMIVIGAVWQISVIVFATVLLTQFSGMGGWEAADVLLIAAMRMMAHGLFVLFFGRVQYLTQRVQEGLIDVCLLRPMSVYRQVQLNHFPVNAIGDLIVAAGLFAGAIARSSVEWTPGRIAFLISGVLGGMLVEAALFTALSSAALHFPAASYWSSWLEELMGTFGNYPLNILPGAVSGALTYILPLAFIAYFPAGVLTGNGSALGVPVWVAACAPLFGLAGFIASRLLWNRSLRHYTGVNG